MKPRTYRWWQAFVALLLANSAIVFAFKGADFVYLTNVLIHLILGSVAVAAFLRFVFPICRSLSRETDALLKGAGLLTVATTGLCLLTGVYLLVFGATTPHRPVLTLHLFSAATTVVLASLYFIRRASIAQANGFERWMRRAGAYMTTLFVFLPALVVGARAAMPSQEKSVGNPRWAPESPYREGDGKGGNFFPSSVQTKNNIFFPPEYYTDSTSCGARGCHPDIVKQWKSSAHRFSSFNNQWYRKSIEYMQEVNGVQSSKWCGGCHDMAVLQTEMPGTGKSRMDFPIKDQVWPPEKFPESHAGIGCAACHSIVHVKSTMGQGDFMADYPAMHRYAISKNPLMKFMHDFLIVRAPEPHKKTFLKPFHRNDTAKFCSSCHKVHLDVPVNNYRWFRGFNEYDAWQNSGVSGGNARAFYYPKDGYKKCADCHMPLVKSNDAANKNGYVKSHRFPAANTALPFVNNDREQFEITKKFLQDGIVTVDIFAIRRASRSETAPTKQKQPNNRSTEPPRESSLFAGESGMLEGAPRQVAQTSQWGEPQLIDGAVSVKPDEEMLIETVVRTRKVGHFFPGGTVDAFDVWLELEGRDERGRKVFHSGGLDFPDGPVSKHAHKYRSQLLDAHGNRINKRNAWAARTAAYIRLIPPGAADTVHFKWNVPKEVSGKVTFTAKLNYRKFEWWNTQFAYAGEPINGKLIAQAGKHDGKSEDGKPLVTKHYDDRKWTFTADTSRVSGKLKEIPKLPIVVVAEDKKDVAVTSDQSPVTSHQSPTHQPTNSPAKHPAEFPLAERWNDYGIGLFLQRDFRTAEQAFQQVIKLNPKWPEGYVNVARVKHDEGDLEEAIAYLKKALRLDAKLAKAHYFYGSSLFQLGQYAQALQHLREVTKQFPEDRVVRNLIGTIYFRQGEFDAAIAEFEKTLQVDPEDLQAHYHLMLCYRGKGDMKKCRQEERLYKRFKADETATQIAGPYLQKNPWDNNEARAIHEHEGA